MASILTQLRHGNTLTHLCFNQIKANSKQLLPATNVLSGREPNAKSPSLATEQNGFIARLCHKFAPDADHEKEIYSGILSAQIKLVKTFSLTTSFIGMACQPILYSYSSHSNLAVMLASGAFLSFFTFVTPVLIHSVSKKYVTKLYYNQVEDKYTAVVYNIFIRPKKIQFRLRDVKVPDVPGAFTTFKAKDYPLFVDMDAFRDPTHYGKIMGYDGNPSKPINISHDDFSSEERKH